MIRFTAPVKLKAKAGRGPARFAIMAYGGDVMNVYPLGPLVVDLVGMTRPASFPLLADHNNAVDAVVGSGSSRVEGGKLLVEGSASNTTAGKDVVELLIGGHPLQASIGANPVEKSWVATGETIRANGRTITADEPGFWLILKSDLKEVTVTPLGADSTTTVSLAAARAAFLKAANHAAKGSLMSMTFEEWIADLGFDVTTLSPEQLKKMQSLYDEETAEPAEPGDGANGIPTPTNAAAVAPAILARRFKEIAEICATAGNPMTTDDSGREVNLLAHSVANGWDTNQVRREALHMLRASRPNAPAAHRGSGGTINAQHLEAALMCRAGYESLAVKAYGAAAVEQSRRMHGASLPDFCAATLRASGKDVPHGRNEMIRAALSGGDWTNLLSNVAGKVLENVWRIAPATWRSWCATRSAPDFKTQTSIRPTFGGKLELLPAGGTIRHNTLGESYFTWRVYQFAAMYSIDRTTIVNDDLGAVSDILPTLGKKALRELSDLIYALVLANSGSFFAAGNGNNQTGAGSALSATSLATAVRQLRNQQDPDLNALDLAPAVLVVPPALEQTARGLLNSQTVMRNPGTDLQPEGNTFQGLARLEVEPRLESGVTDPVSKTTYAGSSTAWYLFASPADMPVVVGFLNGKETPNLESFGFNSTPDRLEQSFRVVHDFGGALGDYRAAQRSAGA